jgi:hypothetical protein
MEYKQLLIVCSEVIKELGVHSDVDLNANTVTMMIVTVNLQSTVSAALMGIF